MRVESRRDLKPVLQYLFADPDLVSRSMVEDLLKYKRLDGVQAALRGLAAALFKDGRQAESLADDLAKLDASHPGHLGGKGCDHPRQAREGPAQRAGGNHRRRGAHGANGGRGPGQ